MKKLTLLIIMAASAAIVACSKGNNGASRGYPGFGYPGGGVAPGCTNCFGNSTPLLIGAQGSHSAVNIGMDLTGDPNMMMQQGINPNDPYAVIRYSGPAQLFGYAQVNNVCGMSGEYYIQTMQAGMVSYGAINGGVILQVTPTNGYGAPMQWQVGSSQFTAPGGLYRDAPGLRIGMNFIAYVNGYPCDQISTY